MSSIYNAEPATKGVITIHTTHGPIRVALWPSLAPKSCRNIVQHALNGYYNNLPFHRIIRDTLLQTGDPTGTGDGGVSADGGAFKGEMPGRVKFSRRGMCAFVGDEQGMVRSQFFVTARETGWLDGMHCVFGCVVGESIFNVVGMVEREVDGFEGGVKVVRISVEENPFEGMVARGLQAGGEMREGRGKGRVGVRNRGLLSFGGSGSESEAERHVKRGVKRAGGRVLEKGYVETKTKVETEAKERGKQDRVICEANAEFERLKAELLGGAADGAKEGETKEGETKEMEKGDAVVVEAEDRREKGLAGDERVVGRGSKRRRADAETLVRLKTFERRLVDERRGEEKGASGAWFAGGLKLAGDGQGAMGGEDEYVVREGVPRGRRRGRR